MQSQIERLVQIAGENEAVAKEFLQRVFPVSDRFLGGPYYEPNFLGQWRRQRRVASSEVLDYYFDHKLAERAVRTQVVETLFQSLEKREDLKAQLSELDPGQLEYALSRLEDYESDFSLKAAEESVPVLMSYYRELSKAWHGMSFRSPRLQLTRLVYRRIRRVENESDRTRPSGPSLRTIDTLSARLEVAQMVENEENVGHDLVPQKDVQVFERDFMGEILAAEPEDLSTEPEIAELVRYIKEKAPDEADDWIHKRFADDALLLTLLEQTVSNVHSQAAGSYAVRITARLPWDFLVAMLGEDYLKQRITELPAAVIEAQGSEKARIAVDMARQYASGWRPSERDF